MKSDRASSKIFSVLPDRAFSKGPRGSWDVGRLNSSVWGLEVRSESFKNMSGSEVNLGIYELGIFQF